MHVNIVEKVLGKLLLHHLKCMERNEMFEIKQPETSCDSFVDMSRNYNKNQKENIAGRLSENTHNSFVHLSSKDSNRNRPKKEVF